MLFLLTFYTIDAINIEVGNPFVVVNENDKGFLYTSDSMDTSSLTFDVDNKKNKRRKHKKKFVDGDSGSEFQQPMNIKDNLKKVKSEGSSTFPSLVNDQMLKKIKKINSLFFEMFSLYIGILIIMILCIILVFNTSYNKNTNNGLNIVQSSNGNWYYKCELEDYNLFLNLGEVCIMIMIIVKGIILNYYENIFKCTKYITYAIIVGILLGPLINVFAYI